MSRLTISCPFPTLVHFFPHVDPSMLGLTISCPFQKVRPKVEKVVPILKENKEPKGQIMVVLL